MTIEQLFIDKLNKIDFCVKHNIVFYDYFKANGLSYPKQFKGLSLVTDNIFKKRKLSFSAHFMEGDCMLDLVFSAGILPSFLLCNYLDKTNPSLKSKLTIEDYKSNSEKKLDTFLIFLNEILYSKQIYKLITTDYWTDEYYVDMWGNYK